MSKDNTKQIALKGAIFSYIGKTLTTIIDAATFILITKRLIVSDYGIYSFLIAILTFFAFFASLGIPYAFLRFIPEYIQKDKKAVAIYIIRLSLYFLAVFGILLIILSFFLAGKITLVFKIASLKSLFPLLVFIGMLYIFIKAGEEILNALFMQVFRNICQIFASLSKLFLFVVILRYNLGIDWLVIAIALIGILQALIYFRKISAYFRTTQLSERPSAAELRRYSIFSVKEYLYVASAFFWHTSFDIYLVAYFLGTVSAGLFNFASSISLFLLYWSPGVVLQSVVSPLFVRIHAQHNNSFYLNKLFELYNKFKAFFLFPITFAIWLLIDKFAMIIYQDKFALAIFPLKILVLAVVIRTFTMPIRNIFNVFEKNEFSLYCNLVIFYRICASIILIKHFGIIGAAYAYASAMLLYFLMHLFLVKRIIKITYPVKSFLKILANSLVMALFLLVARIFMQDSLGWLLVVIASGILIYLFFSYINKPFKKEERDLINEGLGIMAWRF